MIHIPRNIVYEKRCAISLDTHALRDPTYRFSMPVPTPEQHADKEVHFRVILPVTVPVVAMITDISFTPPSTLQKERCSLHLQRLLRILDEGGKTHITAINVSASDESFWKKNDFVPVHNEYNDFKYRKPLVREPF